MPCSFSSATPGCPDAQAAAPFDLDLLRTFVTVVEAGGFTRAAARLDLTQSTVSIHIRRLEDGLGQRVFVRDRRQLALSATGEILLPMARQMLDLADAARIRLLEPDIGGTVRLGTPEDFATLHLPDVLSRFARVHPQVALEVNCDFTANLLDGFAKGQYDLVLCKREPQGPSGGINVWREPLVWVGPERLRLDDDQSIPLVLAPSPDIYRRRALAALEQSGRRWRVVYTSPSLAGVQAAVRAGLGFTVLAKETVVPGLVMVGPERGLPELADTEIALYRAPGTPSKAAALLAEHIVRSLEASEA